MRTAKGPEIQDEHSAQEYEHPRTPTALEGNSHAPGVWARRKHKLGLKKKE